MIQTQQRLRLLWTIVFRNRHFLSKMSEFGDVYIHHKPIRQNQVWNKRRSKFLTSVNNAENINNVFCVQHCEPKLQQLSATYKYDYYTSKYKS